MHSSPQQMNYIGSIANLEANHLNFSSSSRVKEGLAVVHVITLHTVTTFSFILFSAYNYYDILCSSAHFPTRVLATQ